MKRAREYVLAAAKLRRLASTMNAPEVRAELLWLAQSYERLALDQTATKIVDGIRSLEIVPDQTEQRHE